MSPDSDRFELLVERLLGTRRKAVGSSSSLGGVIFILLLLGSLTVALAFLAAFSFGELSFDADKHVTK